jgi:hypothetical protein
MLWLVEPRSLDQVVQAGAIAPPNFADRLESPAGVAGTKFS